MINHSSGKLVMKKLGKIKKEEVEECINILCQKISSFKNEDEARIFIFGFLTGKERLAIGRRIIVAQNLLNKKSYTKIADELGVGMDTIASVRKWLNEGVYKRKPRKKSAYLYDFRDDNQGLLNQLKRKYPLHFLILNVVDELNKKK